MRLSGYVFSCLKFCNYRLGNVGDATRLCVKCKASTNLSLAGVSGERIPL
nr:MAG TPA: hypothetical protein [Bacteriophage sp.]